MNEHQKLIIEILEEEKESELNRMKFAFNGFSEEAMNKKYSGTGMSPNQHISTFTKQMDAAIQWVKERKCASSN